MQMLDMTAGRSATLRVAPMIALMVVGGSCRDSDSSGPHLETVPCRFALADHQREGEVVTCADLSVSSSLAGTGSGQVYRMHVARFHGTNGTKAVPTIYLPGGPGPAQGAISSLSPERLQALTARGDYIVLDYRGEGTSEPRLTCLSGDLVSCAAAAADQGVDLATFDSLTLADDVEQLRRALGAEQLNLVGLSYGTRVALEVLRQRPQTVRAVVLDGPVPPQAPFWADMAANLQQSLEGLFAACAADHDCGAAYPNLKELFFDTIAALQRDPIVIGSVTLDAQIALQALFQAMYRRSTFGRIPAMIAAVSQRDLATLTLLGPSLLALARAGSLGLLGSVVQCNDNLQYFDDDDIQRAVEPVAPQLRQMAHDVARALRDACLALPHKRPDPHDIDPVQSDRPTLILTGALDPVTPTSYGQLAAQTLSNSRLIELPLMGHGAQQTDCGFELMQAFIKDPVAPLNTECLRELDSLRFQTLSGSPLGE